MKIRAYVKGIINGKNYVDGEISEKDFEEMKTGGFDTLTLGKMIIFGTEIIAVEKLW